MFFQVNGTFHLASWKPLGKNQKVSNDPTSSLYLQCGSQRSCSSRLRWLQWSVTTIAGCRWCWAAFLPVATLEKGYTAMGEHMLCIEKDPNLISVISYFDWEYSHLKHWIAASNQCRQLSGPRIWPNMAASCVRFSLALAPIDWISGASILLCASCKQSLAHFLFAMQKWPTLQDLAGASLEVKKKKICLRGVCYKYVNGTYCFNLPFLLRIFSNFSFSLGIGGEWTMGRAWLLFPR